MRMVYTAPNVVPCDFLASLLNASGIWSTIRNPAGSFSVGEGLPISSLVWAWPEVWVNDEDYETAAEIAEDFRKNHASDEASTEET